MKARHLSIIVAGYVGSAVAYLKLPDSFGASSNHLTAVLVSRPSVALFLPTVAAITYLLLQSVWRHDPVRPNDRTSQRVYEAIVLRILLFVIGLHALLLLALGGFLSGQSWAPRAVIVLFGLGLLGIGDLLPRMRPNLVIGIRTQRTLADRRVWGHTNRVTGYVGVGLGLLTVFSGLLGPGHLLAQLLGIAALSGIALIAFCHWRCSRA